jgi:acetyltransferase-like isoleucine patch superfamily enzyme
MNKTDPDSKNNADQESLRDYMSEASPATAMLYIRTRARGVPRYVLEQGTQGLLSWIRGPVGLVLRSRLYRPLLEGGSKSAYLEPGVELFHMDNIRLGESVYVDSLCRLHASEARIELGMGTRVMRGAYLCSYVSNARPGEGIVTGKNCWIGVNTVLAAGQGGVFLGDNVLIAANSVLACGNHDFEKLDLATLDQEYYGRPIRIGHNVWIGAQATVLGGVTVGDHAVVAAGALVNADVDPYTVVGGVPARVLKRLDPPPSHSGDRPDTR